MKSSLYIAHGAKIPFVIGLFWDFNSLTHCNNPNSLNSSGSIPKSFNTFSGPSGCSGGSILVALTTLPRSKCFNTSTSISGQAYISAWYIITISLVAISTKVSYSIVCPNLSGPSLRCIFTFGSNKQTLFIHSHVPSFEKSSAQHISWSGPKFLLILLYDHCKYFRLFLLGCIKLIFFIFIPYNEVKPFTFEIFTLIFFRFIL